MKIGVIGIGNIGGTIARKLKAAGHDVRVANSKGVEGVKGFADEIGATAVDVKGAVDGVDVVVLSIPFPAVSDLPAGLFDSASPNLAVIDTGNYYPGMRDPQIQEIDDGMTESVWVSKQIGHPVTKVFNNILANSLAELGRPEGASDRLAVAVAGDDASAKQIAMTLANEIGFDSVDAGSLEESWRQQPSTPAYCCDYGVDMMRKELAAAVKGEAQKKRDKLPEMFVKLGASPTHEEVVAMNRTVNSIN